MYIDILKIALRRSILILLKISLMTHYGFLMLWLSVFPLSHFWEMLWPLWPVWFVLVVGEVLPSYLSVLLAWLLGIMLDSLYNSMLGLHAIALISISYLKHYFSFTPSIEISKKANEVILIVAFSLLYQIIIGTLQWIAHIPTQMIGPHILGSSITTGLLWYYGSASIKKIYRFFNVDGTFLANG